MIFEDTDLKGTYKNFSRNQDSIPFDFISLIQILLRKFFYYKNKKSITKTYNGNKDSLLLEVHVPPFKKNNTTL